MIQLGEWLTREGYCAIVCDISDTYAAGIVVDDLGVKSIYWELNGESMENHEFDLIEYLGQGN